MVYTAISSQNPFLGCKPKSHRPSKIPSLLNLRPIICFQNQNPNATVGPTFIVKTNQFLVKEKKKLSVVDEKEKGPPSHQVGGSNIKEMLLLCGFGYWVQGFRCFPWLALNFHMANNLNLHPSTLQLVQHFANLPMVAKPLYGIISDAIYIGDAHRVPYISIGVLLQVLSWSLLALVPIARELLPYLIASVLLGNLGASVTEVAQDALVAEYGKKHKIGGLQSYAFMALAAGGILGNLIGGLFLQKMLARNMFTIFLSFMSLQLVVSFSAREDSLGIQQPSGRKLAMKSFIEDIRKQASDLLTAISNKSIFHPLIWIVGSIAMVPVLSGSIFCYQTQCLKLDPTVIGLSKVFGQLMLLTATVLYDRHWKKLSMQKLIGTVQIVYALSLLLDLVLVKQINLKWGIPCEVFTLCFSGLAETFAQFKLLPFSVLFASLSPRGCEGSLASFIASSLCLSSIVSGFLGVGLASMLGVTCGDYSGLTTGIVIQFLAALLPLRWIYYIPISHPGVKKRSSSLSRRARRNRRVGKVVIGSFDASFRREREC